MKKNRMSSVPTFEPAHGGPRSEGSIQEDNLLTKVSCERREGPPVGPLVPVESKVGQDGGALDACKQRPCQCDGGALDAQVLGTRFPVSAEGAMKIRRFAEMPVKSG